MAKQRSILFVYPDYHCSFILRDELRERGWKAEIYVPFWHSDTLLYQNDVVRFKTSKNRNIGRLRSWTGFIKCALRFKVFLFYSSVEWVYTPKLLKRFFGETFRLDLFLLKFFNRRLIYIASGCLDEETKEVFSRLDEGNVCGNCGWSEDVCNDKKNTEKFAVLRRYVDVFLGNGSHESSQYPMRHIKYKSLDLNLWHPGLGNKNDTQKESSGLRIMHSFYDKNRKKNNKNIKGSEFVFKAVEKLKAEGYPVEYYYVYNVDLAEMRYHQAKADIIVEQLIYGWWGSTGVETLSLGKPVVCYLRPDWKNNFLRHFPEYNELPIVEANCQTVYGQLKRLVEDEEYRVSMAKKSREFACAHFDVKKNAQDFESLIW